MGDSFGTHFGASMVTGLATTTITAPVDLIKTRMFMGGGPCNPLPIQQHTQSPVIPHISCCFRIVGESQTKFLQDARVLLHVMTLIAD